MSEPGDDYNLNHFADAENDFTSSFAEDWEEEGVRDEGLGTEEGARDEGLGTRDEQDPNPYPLTPIP